MPPGDELRDHRLTLALLFALHRQRDVTLDEVT